MRQLAHDIAIYETARCRHNVPDYYRMTSGFCVCGVSSEMVIQIFNFFIWDKNFKCLRWNKRNVLVTTLVGFVELFIFCHFVRTERRGHCFLDCMWKKKIDHWFSVTTGKCQPTGPPLHWEIQQALFPTEPLDPWVGIFLSPLNISDGFYLLSSCKVKTKHNS